MVVEVSEARSWSSSMSETYKLPLDHGLEGRKDRRRFARWRTVRSSAWLGLLLGMRGGGVWTCDGD
jgi:hypothetical protein